MKKNIVEKFIDKAINEMFGDLHTNDIVVGEKIRITDLHDFNKYAERVWNILTISYVDIGGIKTYRDFKDFCKKRPILEIIVRDGEVIACATYRKIEGSLKMVAIGCDQTRIGKDALQQIIQGNIKELNLHYWAEVSGAIEYFFKKHNGYPLPNTLAAEVLQINPSQIILSNEDNVHYERVVGTQGEVFKKMIFGFKSEEIYKKAIAEVENYSKFMLEVNNINESVNIYTEKQAIYIIENIYRAHEEDGFNELIPSWHKILLRSLDILKNSKKKSETIKEYIEYGEYLLSDMQVLKCNKLNL